ncbi:hypothetical protein E6O75_ATG10521 [Venturia nashicola]|uniref:Uncharacterized protein n=1 Tax=Venturia nashicola TaxID=86259 RepID=A0A4Z1NPD1_9PEZI|nr:hypothetical protein E6O75_ATG10521 [Venturia nashicola]
MTVGIAIKWQCIPDWSAWTESRRQSINSISLLVDTIHESQCLLEKTTSLSIRLSKWEPAEMAQSCTGIPNIFYSNSPLLTHYFNTGPWDSSLAAILSKAPQVQELMYDWIGPMPFITAMIPTLVNIHKLTIRGINGQGAINEVRALICSRRPFPATLQTLSLKHIALGL